MQEGRRRGAALDEAAGQPGEYQGVRAFAPTSRLYAVFDVRFSDWFPGICWQGRDGPPQRPVRAAWRRRR
jgi:hypothetical protein